MSVHPSVMNSFNLKFQACYYRPIDFKSCMNILLKWGMNYEAQLPYSVIQKFSKSIRNFWIVLLFLHGIKPIEFNCTQIFFVLPIKMNRY